MVPLDPVHEQHLRQMRDDLKAFLSSHLVEIDLYDRDTLHQLNVEQLSRLIRELATARVVDVENCFHRLMNDFADSPSGVGEDVMAKISVTPLAGRIVLEVGVCEVTG